MINILINSNHYCYHHLFTNTIIRAASITEETPDLQHRWPQFGQVILLGQDMLKLSEVQILGTTYKIKFQSRDLNRVQFQQAREPP